MVERTMQPQSAAWSAILLTNIVSMLPAEESITNLKLWSVNKNFRDLVNTTVEVQ